MRTRQIQITRLIVALFTLATCLFFLASRTEAAPPFNGKIAFQSDRTGNNEIFTMNPDGTNPVNLTNNSANDSNPSWSFDGKKIAFDTDRDGNKEIYVMNADGSNPTRLTNNGGGGVFTLDAGPAFSPDGSKIAFQSVRDGNLEIYVMNSNGTNQTRLTFNGVSDLHPKWSPDGTKIIFDSLRDGNAEVYVMNADGTNQTRLTNNPTPDQLAAFSPDGTKILFQRHVAAIAQIFVMNTDGTNAVQLTSTSGGNFAPAFSPDGARITFVSLRDGTNQNEIYVMNSDGANPVRLTNNTAIDGAPNWQTIQVPDTIGLYRPSTSQFLERDTNTAGAPNATIAFGQAGDQPIAGDWNGDGVSDVGVFRNGQFLLRQPVTINILGRATIIFITIPVNFGQAGDLPVVGDWNGDGKDTPGVYRPSTNTFLLTNTNTGNSSPPADIVFGLGAPGDLPVAGDWNGDGITTVGLYRPGTNTFFLTNSFATNVDITFGLGAPGDLPFAGDWDGDGKDTLGLYRPSTSTVFLDNSFTTNVDVTFNFGQFLDQPVSGVWNKPPNSGVNDPSEGWSQAGQVQQFTTTCSDIDGWHNIGTIDFRVSKKKDNDDDDDKDKDRDEDRAGKEKDNDDRAIALWVQFDENNNLIHFYDPDTQTWSSGTPGSNTILSSRFADLHLAQTGVKGSGPNGRSVKITWSVVFKHPAVRKNYKQYLLITDDSGFNTGFDRVGSWSVVR